MAMKLSRWAPLVLVAALVYLAATRRLISVAPAALAAQSIAVILVLWARRSFPAGGFRVQADPGCPAVLRQGPYRFLRHPMYAAALLFLGTGIATHPAPGTLVAGVAVLLAVGMRIATEEKLLRARYPEYAAYARNTKAILPYLL